MIRFRAPKVIPKDHLRNVIIAFKKNQNYEQTINKIFGGDWAHTMYKYPLFYMFSPFLPLISI